MGHTQLLGGCRRTASDDKVEQVRECGMTWMHFCKGLAWHCARELWRSRGKAIAQRTGTQKLATKKILPIVEIVPSDDEHAVNEDVNWHVVSVSIAVAVHWANYTLAGTCEVALCHWDVYFCENKS